MDALRRRARRSPRGPGAGAGTARGLRYGPGDGTCRTLPAPAGGLTAAQKTALARVAEQEKLAHDLYTAFAARYEARVLDRISAAETDHLHAIRVLLDRYHVTDPTAGKAAGAFATATTKATYDRLPARGKASEQTALQIGATAEKARRTAEGEAGRHRDGPRPGLRPAADDLVAAPRRLPGMGELIPASPPPATRAPTGGRRRRVCPERWWLLRRGGHRPPRTRSRAVR